MAEQKALVVEFVPPFEIRVQMPKRFTRFWKLSRKTDCRFMWDAIKQTLVVYNPGNVEFTDDEWLALMLLEGEVDENH